MPTYGLDIAIPYAGDPDPTLPWADDDDALLVPGSIILFEPAHSASPMAGIPALGAEIPNIAWKRFADLVASAAFTGRIDNGTAGNAGSVLTVTAVTSGRIVPGQMINGSGITAEALYVAAQLTGTAGGVGTYSVYAWLGQTAANVSVASTTITATAIDASLGALYRDGFADVAGVSLHERSGKGGWHTIRTQTNDVTSSGHAVRGKARLEAYISANPNHSYYVSMWDRVTRVATANEPFEMLFAGTTTVSYVATLPALTEAANWGPLVSSGRRLGATMNPSVSGQLGNRFRASAASAMSGNGPNRTFMNISGMASPWGTVTAALNKSASRIVYRVYAEDLTVSGRTYAEVQAADYALWQSAFAAGGRYAGDTFTVPSI